MSIRKRIEQFRYLRSFRVLLFSIIIIVFSIIALFENYKRNTESECVKGIITNVKYVNRWNKSRTVLIYDVKIYINNTEFKQGFVDEKEFKKVKSNIVIGDSLEICHHKGQVLIIKSKDKRLYESGFSNISIVSVFVLGLGMFAFIVYYLIRYKNDLAN
ncbi:MAG: hypothetical protein ACQETL_20130 [Bacteroidota bacterium]